MILRKSAQLHRFEGRHAVLRLESGQEFQLPKEELGGAELGSAFVVQILPEAEAALDRNDLARTLLNQILNEQPRRTASDADTGG